MIDTTRDPAYDKQRLELLILIDKWQKEDNLRLVTILMLLSEVIQEWLNQIKPTSMIFLKKQDKPKMTW